MNPQDIDTSFGDDNEPKDQKLLDLLKDAYTGKLKCRKAIINMDLIKPFSDFEPEITKEYRADFLRGYLNLKPPELYVYEQDSGFIMSDDYLAYYMYKEVAADTALCVIIGEYTETDGITAGPEFDLQLPSIETPE